MAATAAGAYFTYIEIKEIIKRVDELDLFRHLFAGELFLDGNPYSLTDPKSPYYDPEVENDIKEIGVLCMWAGLGLIPGAGWITKTVMAARKAKNAKKIGIEALTKNSSKNIVKDPKEAKAALKSVKKSLLSGKGGKFKMSDDGKFLQSVDGKHSIDVDGMSPQDIKWTLNLLKDQGNSPTMWSKLSQYASKMKTSLGFRRQSARHGKNRTLDKIEPKI